MMVLWATRPRARKEHRCCLCGRTIQPGEQYERQRSVGNDGPQVFKQCAHCTALVSRLNNESGDWYDDDWGYDADCVIDFDTDDDDTRALIEAFRSRWASATGDLVLVPERTS